MKAEGCSSARQQLVPPAVLLPGPGGADRPGAQLDVARGAAAGRSGGSGPNCSPACRTCGVGGAGGLGMGDRSGVTDGGRRATGPAFLTGLSEGANRHWHHHMHVHEVANAICT